MAVEFKYMFLSQGFFAFFFIPKKEGLELESETLEKKTPTLPPISIHLQQNA